MFRTFIYWSVTYSKVVIIQFGDWEGIFGSEQQYMECNTWYSERMFTCLLWGGGVRVMEGGLGYLLSLGKPFILGKVGGGTGARWVMGYIWHLFFLSVFTVAFLFNWIGFFLSFCLTTSAAGRYGAISGFGLSLIKWILIVRVSCTPEKIDSVEKQ